MTHSAAPDATLANELVGLAAAIAREAGELVRRGRTEGLPDSDTKSSPTDVVTVFDTASERLIAERLLVARPADGLLGEEGAARPGTSGIEWVVDPIDGTTNFLYGLPGYNVSIAATDADGSVAGAVYLPATNELFTATRGGGAFLDGTPIRCTEAHRLDLALVATGFAYQPERRALQGRRAAQLLPRIRDLRRLGAAAADLCYVACGRLDGYYEQYLNPWDVAAGGLIAAEAGARVGSFSGAAGESDGVLAAGSGLYDALLDAVLAAAPSA